MGTEGETWRCPHCGELILQSAVTCPACQRRLRFNVVAPLGSVEGAVCPFSVEGVIRHPVTDGPMEYTVLVHILDGRGEMLARRVVGVGVIRPGETRRFTLRIEMHIPEKSIPTTAIPRRPATEESAHGRPPSDHR